MWVCWQDTLMSLDTHYHLQRRKIPPFLGDKTVFFGPNSHLSVVDLAGKERIYDPALPHALTPKAVSPLVWPCCQICETGMSEIHPLLCLVDKLTFYPLWPRAVGCSTGGLWMQKVLGMCYFWSRFWASGMKLSEQTPKSGVLECPAGSPWILHISTDTALALVSRSPSTDSH